MSVSSLLLNFLPVALRGETRIFVGYRPYEQETLEELRQEFGQSHVFKRNYEDNTILEIPVITGAEPLSNTSAEEDLAKAPWLWKPLLNAALLRVFAGQREIVHDYPVSVLGNPLSLIHI